jgi:hypothetical protein
MLMKKLFAMLALVGVVSTVACVKTDLKNILIDFQWGLKEACSQNWIPTSDCQIADNAFDISIDIVNKDAVGKIKQDVESELQGVIAKLPEGSGVTPFLAGALAFLTAPTAPAQ